MSPLPPPHHSTTPLMCADTPSSVRAKVTFAIGSFPGAVVLLLTGYLGRGVLYNRVVKRLERKGFAACPHHEALAALPRRCVSLCGWECTRFEPLGMVVPSSATDDSDDEIEDEVAYEYGDDNEGDDMEEGRGDPWHAAVEIIKRGRFKSKSIHRVE